MEKEYKGNKGYGAKSEGRSYGAKPAGGSYGAKTEGRSYGAKTEGKSYGAKTEGRSYGAKTEGKSYGAKPAGGSYGAKTEGRSYGAKTEGKSYGAKPEGKSYGAKPEGRSYGANSEGRWNKDIKPKDSFRGAKDEGYVKKTPSYENKRADDDQGEGREDVVAGRNPVMELLKSETPVDNIYIQKAESKSGTILKIMSMAREKGLVIKEVTKEKLDSLSNGVNHQGVAAVVAAYEFATLESIIAKAGDEKLFVIIADEIEDPHNLGAIIRTADAAGAHGVIIPNRRGTGLTSAVMRASAGAAQHVAVAKVTNLVQVIDQLKEMGVWIYSADMDGKPWCSVDYSGGVGLVVGSEGRGVSRLVKEHSDVVVSLPMNGKVNSLNASVAAGIIMYEVARQRLGISLNK